MGTRHSRPTERPTRPPSEQGLYHPDQERDSCGVGFVVNIKGERSHKLVQQAFEMVINLLHRGACGCEVNTGDGAGMLLQLPHRFFQKEADRLSMALPDPGAYGVGMVFLPRDPDDRGQIEDLFLHMSPRRRVSASSAGGTYRPMTRCLARPPRAVSR